MSKPANTLPLPVRRQLDGRCERCDELAISGKHLCQWHTDNGRARRQRADKKRRRALRKAKRCVDCKKPCKKRRCRGCKRTQRGANQTQRGANQAVGKWRVDPGTTWNRYRGKGRRGRLTREAQIDEDIREAGFAIEELRKFVEKAAVLKRSDVIDLPTIQRAAARREVGQHLGFSGRLIDALADKYG